jgi:hypothetical protein
MTGNQVLPRWALCALLAGAGAPALAQSVQLEALEVTAPRLDPEGAPATASQGSVSREAIEARPVYRVGEVLEAMPGLIVSSHSGEGKANQYFLRGFNLDHGTDFAVWVDNMPVNMRTHAHGQGYADLGFFIPELARQLSYRKGPYFAQEGDFSAAGATHIAYLDALERDLALVSGGSFGYARGLYAGSQPLGRGTLLQATEVVHYDGPWRQPDDLQKINGVVRYSEGSPEDGFAVTAMAYGGRWNATNPVARRAVDGGLIDRFGTLDPSDGGNAQRYSLSGQWQRAGDAGTWTVSGYAIANTLALYNDFTYFLNDPVHGDQIKQSDRRIIAGGEARLAALADWGGREVENTLGLQLRTDDIRLGLFNTEGRAPLSTVRDDRVLETSAGLYVENTIRWLEKFRTVAGLRGDLYYADVASDNALNSGTVTAFQSSPKLGLIFGPWADTEFFANAGRGFHSNDARGATIRVDPRDPSVPQTRVPLLVSAVGEEIGLRTTAVPGLETTVALFRLDFDSELVFQGDTGTTEAGRPSRRVGIELTNRYQATGWLALDADLAVSRARFTDSDPAGNHIPGSVGTVVAAGATVDGLGPWFGALRLRYFGPRALIEDNSVSSRATGVVDLRAGLKLTEGLRAQLEIFNLLNAKASQIDYFYASRLQGEPAGGVSDIHFHPVEPTAARLTLRLTF